MSAANINNKYLILIFFSQEEAYLPGVGDGAIVNDFKAFKNEKKVLFVKDIVKVKK